MSTTIRDTLHNGRDIVLPSRDARIKWGKHGEYKADYYSKHKGNIFIESSLQQATTIARLSHKDVICIETNTLIKDDRQSLYSRIKRKLKRKAPHTFQTIKRALHSLGR